MFQNNSKAVFLQFVKKTILFLLFGVLTMSGFAQRNRYGMKLKEENGTYQLDDKEKYKKILKDDFTSFPEDVNKLYPEYNSERIKPEDYNNCITHKYLFKSYPEKNYVLNMEVDIPKVELKGQKSYPFIIWVHGGGWVNGDLNVFKNKSQYLASRGIAGVRISYSLQKNGGHFEQGMQELDEALQFVKKHAKEWGLDSTHFGFAGASAGSPLSALAAMQNSTKGCCLYIGGNGIFDFVNNRQGRFCGGDTIKHKYLENIDDFESISAINFIPEKKSEIPAVILFHGTADITISHRQSVAFHNKVTAAGGTSELHLYEHYTHAFYNKNRSDACDEVTLKMYDFSKRIFKVILKD